MMGTMGISITLANGIIGVGILAMPFCFQQCGVLLATIILLFMGLVSRLCCYYLLKSALIARRRNFEFLAFHVFGSAGKVGVELGIIGFLMGTCIAYFVVVGDLGPPIVAKMFDINQSDVLRTSIMVIVSLVCVLPMGLLRNIDSLSNVSAATICFYFCLVIKVIAEAASQLLTNDWQSRVEMWRPAGVLQCVPIFSMALFCQTQLFEVFESLPSLSLEKMNLTIKNAVNVCTGVYFTLGLFGYIAFSAQDNISGNILVSLSPTLASDVIKLGFVLSVAFSFPLVIFPCRASLYSFLYKKVHSSHHDHIINHSIPERSFRCITVGIVAAALLVGLVLPNIELVLGLVGSTIGVLICIVFPAACFINVTFKNTNERVLAKAILVLGLIIMVLGTYANLQAAESQIEKYDEKYFTKERIDKMVDDFFQKMEKEEGVMVKPEIHKSEEVKVDNDVIKESVALPPNPVPPESQPVENDKRNENDIKQPKKLKEPKPDTVQDVDKVSETHPKNLNKLNDAKISNDASNKDEAREETKIRRNEDKINIMKQQQLIETIKQHGEEQKELIKEQKEILTEIKKTKEELQKSKKETAEADAKKLAVESIKKIANVAIQSLASVSDKPGEAGDESKLEKLADEAVQEIAQKAVETIEAIKDNDKPESAPQDGKAPAPPRKNTLNQTQNNMQMNQNVQPNAQPAQNNIASNQNMNINPEHLQNVNQQSLFKIDPSTNVNAPVDNIPAVQKVAQMQNGAQSGLNVARPNPNSGQPVLNAGQPALNAGQPALNAGQPVLNAGQPVLNAGQPVLNAGQPVPNVVQPNVQKRNIAEPAAKSNVQKPSIDMPIQNPNLLVQNVQPAQSHHSHSPDEPQSYKQGEDTQNDVEKTFKISQNAPLPIVKSQNGQNGELPTNLNNVKKIDYNQNAPIRQKREVVDCTEKSNLKPEDKEICKALIDTPGVNMDVKDILASKVDLNDVALPKDIAFQGNIIHHISRNLKMYENNKR